MSASLHPSLLLHSRQQSAKQSKMSITQTFYLAHKARGKLSSEAARSDHNLRLLVGHANLLDSLMLHLQAAEREQDAWYNAMVRGNSVDEEDTEDAMDTILEEEEDNFGSLAQDYPESDSSDDDEEEEYEYPSVFPPRPTGFDYARKTTIDEIEVEGDEFEEEEDGFYALRRTSSHAPSSPPDLVEDDFSDTESNPPSPPQPTLATPIFYEEKTKNKQQNPTSAFYDSHSSADLMDPHHLYQSSNLISAF